LSQATLLLTRSIDDNTQWAQALKVRGIQSRSVPCILCETNLAPGLEGEVRAALANADWLALTSRRGARAVQRLIGHDLGETRVICVGKTTAAAARTLLGCEPVVSAEATALGLARTLLNVEPHPASTTVVIAAADRANTAMDTPLAEAGLKIKRFPVYRTRAVQPGELPPPDLADVDAILLASPSAAEGLANLLGHTVLTPVITIGPTTTQAARRKGFSVAAEAQSRGLEGLVAAFKKSLTQRPIQH